MVSNRSNPRNGGRVGARRMASSGAGMSRGRFLRTAGISAAGLGAAAMGLGGVAHAASGVKYLTGTGNSANDVQAVQEAVDNYAKVYLQGTFDFGQGSVVIKNDVMLSGYGATIKNGVAPIRIYDEVEASIMGIHFKMPALCGVVVSAAKDVTVKDNTFMSTQAAPTAVGMMAWPIMVGEWNYAFLPGPWFLALPGEPSPGQMPPAGSRAEEINMLFGTGPAEIKSVLKVNIMNNKITQTDANIDFGPCIAVWEILEEAREKYYIIENNVCENQTNNWVPGIWVVGCGDGLKSNIRNNTLINCVGGVSIYSHYFYDHGGSGHIISNNSMSTIGSGIELSGVLDSVVQGNKINILSGVGMYVWASGQLDEDGNFIYPEDARGSSDNVISKNILSGSTDFGIWLGDFPPYLSSDRNTVLDNNLRELNLVPGQYGFASHAAFLPNSAYNVFIGHRNDQVLNIGSNNQVVLGRKVSKDIKAEVRTIHQEYKEKMQEVKDAWMSNKH